MRRTGVRISVFRNFIIDQIFPEFLQPLRDLRIITQVAQFYRGFLFLWFWNFVGLDFLRSPWSIINRIWHLHWRDVTLNPIVSFSSLNFTYCRWRRWGWRRWWGRTWQTWNHDRNEILRVAGYPNPVFNEMWFLTIDPFIRIPVFIAKLSTAGVLSRTFKVKNISNSLTHTTASSFFHAYWYRGGNYNCLLYNTVRWTPNANNLQEFFARAVLSLDYWPRLFSHNFHFWRQNSYFVCLAR